MSKLNELEYSDLKTKVIEIVTDLHKYDDDVLTPPKEVSELWEKSEHFEEWLIAMLSRCGRVTLDTLEEENLLMINNVEVKCPACGTRGYGKVNCSCPVVPDIVK